MAITASFWARMGVLSAVAAMWGCMGSPDATDGDEFDSADTNGSAIIGGTPATGFPEAVLVNMVSNTGAGFACSGSLIAPQVVLTAGHCVNGIKSWTVTLPFAGKQTASSTSGKVFDYKVDSETVDPTKHDVGLVFLSKALSLTTFPSLAAAPVANGTKIVNIGRIDDGVFSNAQLFVSPALSVSDAKNSGFPFDYIGSEIIQSGDSGGPDIVAGTHKIVAVNSGAGGGTEVLARVDLVKNFITTEVAAHGGFKNGGGFK